MRTLAYLLCAAMLLGLLAGCSQAPTDETVPQATETADIRPLPPENPGSSLIEYDPDRQIYIGTENIYMDYYMGITGIPCLNIPVYSRFSLGEPDDWGEVRGTQVELSWNQPLGEIWDLCDYNVFAVEVQHKTEFMAGEDDAPESVMPYYVYQAYRGGNAAALANAKISYKPDGSIPDSFRADFEALTAENLPEFYVYNIQIRFNNMPEPEKRKPIILEKLKLTVDGQTYEGAFGGVRFFNREDCTYKKNKSITPEYAGKYTENTSELYSDGLIRLLRIPVLENVEYEGIYIADVCMLDEGSKMLDAYVTVMDSYGQYYRYSLKGLQNNEYSYTYRDIRPGDDVYVDVIVKNEHADKLLSSVHFQIGVQWGRIVIDESAEDPEDPDNTVYTTTPYFDVYTVVGTTNTNPYENYAIIFDGVNMEPYYDYYFENYESWRKDYLN